MVAPAYSTCVSGVSYPALTNGTHVFGVRAADELNAQGAATLYVEHQRAANAEHQPGPGESYDGDYGCVCVHDGQPGAVFLSLKCSLCRVRERRR